MFNLPQASGFLSDGKLFYGRVLKADEKNMTLIGMKSKRVRIYTFGVCEHCGK